MKQSLIILAVTSAAQIIIFLISRFYNTKTMKKRFLLACLRTPLYLLIHLATFTLWLSRFLWQQLDRFENLEGLSVRQLAARTGKPYQEAYALWKKLNPEKTRAKEQEPELEIYADGKPLPRYRENTPLFTRKNIANAL